MDGIVYKDRDKVIFVLMGDELEQSKKEMRKAVLELRNKLSTDDILLMSRDIFHMLKQMERFAESRMIMSFVSFGSEVCTIGLIEDCLSMGKRVCVPLITVSSDGCREMIASEIFSISNDLEPGTKGILEPAKGKVRKVDPGDIDIVLVPGVVFSRDKYRIGYGGGYYDRFLPLLGKDCLKAGIAFDLQIYDRVPAEKHDVPVDIIITEKAIIA